MVECNLAKVDVAGSNPVSRSRLYANRLYASNGGRPSPELNHEHIILTRSL